MRWAFSLKCAGSVDGHDPAKGADAVVAASIGGHLHVVVLFKQLSQFLFWDEHIHVMEEAQLPGVLVLHAVMECGRVCGLFGLELGADRATPQLVVIVGQELGGQWFTWWWRGVGVLTGGLVQGPASSVVRLDFAGRPVLAAIPDVD